MKEHNFTVTSLESDFSNVGTLLNVKSIGDLTARIQVALGEHFDGDAILLKDFGDEVFEPSFLEKDFSVKVGDDGDVYKCSIQKTWLY
jgi:hypothetical protein